MLKNFFLKIGFGILIVVFFTSNANALAFFDGTFVNTDWTLTVEITGNGGTSTGSQKPSGGNPGEYRKVHNIVFGGGYNYVIGYHFFNKSEYSPSLQGEITSIDFSIDHKMFIGFGEGQRVGPAIFQGGQFFVGEESTLANQYSWETLSVAGIKAENFSPYFGPATIHPDFSASGGQILFGFYTVNSDSGYSITIGVDNWSVNLRANPAPLPSSIVLLVSGLGGIIFYRRRQSNPIN